MSQQDIITFLAKNKSEWCSARYIAEEIGISNNTATKNLMKLRETNALNYNSQRPKLYKYKR